MSKDALAVVEPQTSLQRSKPRYTEAENNILFDSWWNPQKRRELVGHLGRKMSALRSQFCRLLKEKGMTNQDYYNMMQAKYAGTNGTVTRKRSRELKPIDRTILEIFCKHQALGNSRAQACDELQQILGSLFTSAALKLRFYRLIKRLQYSDQDLLNIGKQLLGEGRNDSIEFTSPPQKEIAQISSVTVNTTKMETVSKGTYTERGPAQPVMEKQIGSEEPSQEISFLYQLSSLPETIKRLEERVIWIEENQRHQLDLRGFIEHLLAVERDIKREDKLMEEIQRLMDENQIIQNTAEKERERLKRREEELSEVYRMLETMLSDFMRLESVSKLASLGDFMHRLEITVDQFGNVLKSKRVTA
ncbi:MAG TPA: hypothetical protein VF531_08495 [Bacillota bacterium]